jgi:regulator of cell morphogenesis and NO signaling
MSSILSSEKIHEIVEKDYVFAHALYFFGVKFYDYSEDTLEQLSQTKGFTIEQVLRKMDNIRSEEMPGPDFFQSYSVDLIIEYLKHAHHIYIKEKIPYLIRLIADLGETDKLTHDLKLIFPYFIEDFIKHIYHEEDSLFDYTLKLHNSSQTFNAGEIHKVMRKYSISDLALHHSADDDEMEGIRELTSKYSLEGISSIHLKVVYQELKAFETDLLLHARIENEVLFPKALSLEKKVADKLTQISRQN